MDFGIHFWEGICFILLVVISYRPVKRAASSYLDDYAETIKQKVTEAEKLCEEAEKTLQHYIEQHKMFTNKIDSITKNTEENIRDLKKRAVKKLEEKIKVKRQIQQDRLDLYNKQEMHKIKKTIINKSMTLVACYLDDVDASNVTQDQITQVLNIVKDKSITFH